MSVVQNTFFRGVVPDTLTSLTLKDKTGTTITSADIVITNVIINNKTNSSKTVTLEFPASDGTSVPVLAETLINANDTVSFDMKQAMTIGTSPTRVIKVQASLADSVYIHLSGVVIT
jgi:hypothetical protein